MEQWKSYLRKWGQGCNVETRQEMCKPDFLSCDKNISWKIIQEIMQIKLMHGKMKHRKRFCSKESTNKILLNSKVGLNSIFVLISEIFTRF